jgi:translation initiation factor 4G
MFVSKVTLFKMGADYIIIIIIIIIIIAAAGLLCQIFQVLWDDNTISNETFIAWEESVDPAEQAGKGVALKSLTTFFTALREGDEDSSCEES